MLDLDLRADEVIAFFDRYQRHFPFAGSVALNRTVEEALAAERRNISARFIVRRPGFVLPPQQLPATWRATKDRLWAKMDIADDDGGKAGIGARRKAILAKFEEGGRKTARDPNLPIAIPTKVLRPAPTNLVPQRLYPRNLVGRFDTLGGFRGLARTARSRASFRKGKGETTQVWRRQVGRYFVLGALGERGFGIYERTGPGRQDVRRLWIFRQAIPIPARLAFEATARQVIEERFHPNMEGAFELALRTAR